MQWAYLWAQHTTATRTGAEINLNSRPPRELHMPPLFPCTMRNSHWGQIHHLHQLLGLQDEPSELTSKEALDAQAIPGQEH